jgi:hypothetical protein
MAKRSALASRDMTVDIAPGPVEWSDTTRTSAKGAAITGPSIRTRIRLSRELVLVAVLGMAYGALGRIMKQSGPAASAHALSIVHLETDFHLFHEEEIQAAFLRESAVVRLFGLYYGGTHFLIPAGALIWLARRHPERYVRARSTLAITTGIGFLCFWAFPVAPPRMLPARFGIVDTLVRLGKSGHLESTHINSAGDRYASMPSLHVAWALWCMLVLYPVVRHRALRAALVLYPMITTLVVIVTGNHNFLDAMAGALLGTATWATANWGRASIAARSNRTVPLLMPSDTRVTPALHERRSGISSGRLGRASQAAMEHRQGHRPRGSYSADTVAAGGTTPSVAITVTVPNSPKRSLCRTQSKER